MIKKNWNRLIWVFMLIMLLLNACSVLGEVTTKEGIETTESAGDDTTVL